MRSRRLPAGAATVAEPHRLFIHEVALRDGLQIEPAFVPTRTKIGLIDRLGRTGVAKIEATSFSSPKAIPTLADAAEVMDGITRIEGVEYAVLVPNLRGCARALDHRPDEINVVVSASETHNRANVRMTTAQSLDQFAGIAALAASRAAINLSISTAFGCPFEGAVAPERVLALVERVAAIGIDRVTLCDTTGVANPAQVGRLFGTVMTRFPDMRWTAHFHDTRGMALANALAALDAGVVRLDASLGGLGGCPFAPGASGNACTEDLVHMFEAMGHPTAVDLPMLLDIARSLPAIVGHDVPGQLIAAGPFDRRYPVPDWLASGEQSRLATPQCAA